MIHRGTLEAAISCTGGPLLDGAAMVRPILYLAWHRGQTPPKHLKYSSGAFIYKIELYIYWW